MADDVGLAIPGAWLLAAVRTWALLRVQPVWRTIVGPWWEAIAAALAVVVTASVLPRLPASPPVAADATFVLTAVQQVVVGTLLGLLAALPGFALLGGATASATVLGLRRAPGPTVALVAAVVACSGLSLGLHHPLLAAAGEALVLVPLHAAPWDAATRLATALPQAAHAMLVLALSLATPALLAAAVVETTTRVLARGPEPADVLEIAAPWLRVAAAAIALAASLAAYAGAWSTALLPA